MKHISTQLNKAFDNRIRLGIMSILAVNEWVDFSHLKELLALTDGNLASHITALEKEQYIEYEKKFVAKRPQTTYRSTEKGRKAFEEHLTALETLLKGL